MVAHSPTGWRLATLASVRRYLGSAQRISAGMAVAAYMGEPGLERELGLVRARLTAD